MESFAKFEHEGWQRVAGKYDSVWASSTRQFILPLLDAAEVSGGMSVPDIGCGPGYVSAAATARGAIPRGVPHGRITCAPDAGKVASNSIRHRGIGSSLRQGRRLCYSQSNVCYRGGQESTNGERRGEKAEGGGMRLCFLTVILLASTIALAAGKDAPITEQELVQRTQELYDAVAAGNQAPWKQYFADDCIFSDEKGRTMDKSKLVADITSFADWLLWRDQARACAESDLRRGCHSQL
jgi:hypothetical protein